MQRVDLPKPRDYFPVAARYTMPGRSFPLGEPEAGALHIEIDDALEHYRKAKLPATLAQARCGDMADDEQRVADWLRDRTAADFPRLSLPTACPAQPALADRVSAIQEDLVIMRKRERDAPAAATADYLHVSFPSGWCPACMSGRNFEAMHSAVPDVVGFKVADHKGARVRRRSDLASWLYGTQTKVRFVWTVASDADLDRRACHIGIHPTVRKTPWSLATAAYLRVERQVIVPIDQRLSVFLIRIYVYPVGSLRDDRRATLREAIRSMSPTVAKYKGLSDTPRIMELLA